MVLLKDKQHFEIVITHESNGFIILHMKRKDFIHEFYTHLKYMEIDRLFKHH